MTWQQFKDEVDRQIAEEGLSPDAPIAYIDVTRPDMEYALGKPEVFVDRKNGEMFIETLSP